jgi:hypothetical protein
VGVGEKRVEVRRKNDTEGLKQREAHDSENGGK